MTQIRLLLTLAALSLTCVSCNKNGPLTAEVETAEKELNAKKEQLLTLQNESKKLNAAMGKYSNAGQGLIDQLTKESSVLHTAIQVLKGEKQAAEEKKAKLRSEIQAYLTAHSKH